jgi:hypothetical protein
MCARQNGDGIAKKEELRQYCNQILVVRGMSDEMVHIFFL